MDKFRQLFRRLAMPTSNVQAIVLGHQKAGTTVVAALLGKVSGLKVSIDPLYVMDWGNGNSAEQLLEKPHTLRRLCRFHPKILGQDIIKDPDLTLIYPSVRKCFPRAASPTLIRSSSTARAK